MHDYRIFLPFQALSRLSISSPPEKTRGHSSSLIGCARGNGGHSSACDRLPSGVAENHFYLTEHL
jgi:hypothetical protein